MGNQLKTDMAFLQKDGKRIGTRARTRLLLAEINRLEECVARLTAERDEARRLCCEHAAMDEGGYVKHGTMLHFAESRGWDCFKEVAP